MPSRALFSLCLHRCKARSAFVTFGRNFGGDFPPFSGSAMAFHQVYIGVILSVRKKNKAVMEVCEVGLWQHFSSTLKVTREDDDREWSDWPQTYNHVYRCGSGVQSPLGKACLHFQQREAAGAQPAPSLTPLSTTTACTGP